MIDIQLFFLFLIASLILLLTPGPSVLYILSRSIEQGKKAGFISILGIGVGNIIHVIAATLGLSLIIMKSIFLFNVIKAIGAAYLVYLGIKAFRQKTDFNFGNTNLDEVNLKNIFIDGVIVNVFNPKTAMFFLAFIPQFLNVGYGRITLQTLFYGLSYSILALLTDAIYVLLSAKVRDAIRKSIKFRLYQKYIIGSVYLILGFLTLFTNSNRVVSK